MADLRFFISIRPNLDNFEHFWSIFYQFLLIVDIFGQKVLKHWLRLRERHELFAGLETFKRLAGLSLGRFMNNQKDKVLRVFLTSSVRYVLCHILMKYSLILYLIGQIFTLHLKHPV